MNTDYYTNQHKNQHILSTISANMINRHTVMEMHVHTYKMCWHTQIYALQGQWEDAMWQLKPLPVLNLTLKQIQQMSEKPNEPTNQTETGMRSWWEEKLQHGLSV